MRGSRLARRVPGSERSRRPGSVVDLGQLNFGQTRDFVIKVADCAAEDCVVEARLGEVVITGAVSAPSPEKVAVQRGRVELVRALAAARSAAAFGSAKAMPLLGETQTMMQALVAEAGDSGYIGDLLQDLEGQVALAVSRQDWYQKWGTHYLPSLQRAHALQLCNNFKDPGVQQRGRVPRGPRRRRRSVQRAPTSCCNIRNTTALRRGPFL